MDNKKYEISLIHKQLRDCSTQLTYVWDKIIDSNLCPSDFGLHNSCDFANGACKECWKKAIEVVSGSSVYINNYGFYACKHCGDALIFDQIYDGAEIWHCPKCKQKFSCSVSADNPAIYVIDAADSVDISDNKKKEENENSPEGEEPNP